MDLGPAVEGPPRPADNQYQYRELEETHFRVLHLQPGEDDPITFMLEHHPIDQSPVYEAISYCWGDGGAEMECLCSDGHTAGFMSLTTNLWQALREFRRPSEVRKLWVDQICIDQQNVCEKPHQIFLMGRIFSQANRVLVWLGEADVDTDTIFDLICDIRVLAKAFLEQGERQPFPASISPKEAVEWAALRKLFTRPWFSRLWCFQEIVLTNDGSLCCGSRIVDFGLLLSLCGGLYSLDNSNLGKRELLGPAGQDFVLTFTFRYAPYLVRMKLEVERLSKIGPLADTTFGILNLLKVLMSRKSSLPHDKIYGLLGVARDANPTLFSVTYAEPFRETFARACRFIIGLHSDLVSLKLTGVTPYRPLRRFGPEELPSWTPDFRFAINRINNARTLYGTNYLQHGAKRFYNASGLSKASTCEENALQLSLHGILFGHVVSLSEPDKSYTDYADYFSIGENVLVGGSWFAMAQICAQEGIYGPTNQSIALAYAQLRVNDRLPQESNRESRKSRVLSISDLPDPLPGLRLLDRDRWTTDAINRMVSRVLECTTAQRLFITDNGYMGLAHESCQVGDLVYVMMGADMPLMVRKLETGMYQYKGESYVHGIMDGEFLLKRFKNDNGGDTITDEEWLDSLADEPLPFPTEKVTLV